MDANTEAIVRLAWTRRLGLADDAMNVPGERLYAISTDAVSFISIWGRHVMAGPEWARQRAVSVADDELTTHAGLLALTADRGGHGLGPAVLAYADVDTAVRDVADDKPLISNDHADVRRLESLCPPDDVNEAGLSARESVFVLLDDDAAPVAAAGFDEWNAIVAHMAVLTAPNHRHLGAGATIAAIATSEALDAGLVPGWRSHIDNKGSRRLAASLGYEEVGTQTTVLLAS
ncbi:GNAT family N-acetyltransferase [Spelaeicoccus albus]|uniref:N-acetyltransferase domain-containing protein n=1 Tax=Spelaeicoccus albus TaxID=1280376 RepID=A0A7Z0IGX9_9MICO|nr:GNAT family N-acetyltransferase [Spelaeicoccus albus]NYI67428.1 hypothetical protein [Spelaeicoccus albus]